MEIIDICHVHHRCCRRFTYARARSAVQHECIPQAILGMDVVCQAKSGMGKTAVFVLAVLQQMEKKPENHVHVLVMCHTRELAYQVKAEFNRFTKCASNSIHQFRLAPEPNEPWRVSAVGAR